MSGRRIEYLPAIIATGDHMIETAFDINSRFSRHGRRMPGLDLCVRQS